MSEDKTVVKTIENVDKLFSQIVVNGEVYNSERYVEPEPKPVVKAVVPKKMAVRTAVIQPETRSTVDPTRSAQGEDVYAVELNDILHNFVDRAVAQELAEETGTRARADEQLQESINDINSKIPSEASSSNKLADKASVGTSINTAIGTLDVPSAGGNGKYIKAISETDGKISATTGNIDSTVTEDSSNPVTSGAVFTAIQSEGADVSQAIADAIADEVTNRNSAITSAVADEATARNSAISDAIAGEVTNRNTAISNAVNALDVSQAGGNGKYIKAISETDGKISATEGTIDSSVTSGSDNPVTGGAVYTAINVVKASVDDIEALIPNQATSSNQLADKAFVNSSITSNTANFLGTYTSLAQIQAIPNPTNNDYAFLQTTDSAGNTEYQRYKYSTSDNQWHYEYTLNNSSFTAEQWATINSGLTQASVEEDIASAVADEASARNTAIANAVNALDVSQAGGSGKYIKAISETDGKISATEGTIDSSVTSGSDNPVTGGAVDTALAGKVDKVNGKGLSTNDFTNALKTKLDGIEAGAQVNTVTGVKGNSESTYRTGNINITKGDIGLGSVVNTGDSAVPAEGGTDKFTTGGAYTELTKKADVLDLAPAFSTGTNYSAGAYVTYNGDLYRFKTKHTAGAWSSSEVEVCNVGAQLNRTFLPYSSEVVSAGSTPTNKYVLIYERTGAVTGFSSPVILQGFLGKISSIAKTIFYMEIDFRASNTQAPIIRGYMDRVINDADIVATFDTTTATARIYAVINSNYATVRVNSNYAIFSADISTAVATPEGDYVTYATATLMDLGKADMADLAPLFSSSTSYSVGQYVTYIGTLYRCTVAHSAGAWDSSHFTAVTVGGELENLEDNKANRTELAVPSDAVLHYSFDDVPDYPDGTNIYYKNNNFTVTSDFTYRQCTGSIVDSKLNLKSNGNESYFQITGSPLSISNIAGKIVIVKFRATGTLQRVSLQNDGGSYSYQTFSLIKEIAQNEYIATTVALASPQYNQLLAFKFENASADNIALIEALYIGNGSYNTPIIDNSGNKINATNNGGLAVEGVCGKGVYFPSAIQEAYLPTSLLTAPSSNNNFSISIWLNVSTSYVADSGSSVKDIFSIGSTAGLLGFTRRSNTIRAVFRDSSNDRYVEINMDKGVWHNYTLVYNGTTHSAKVYDNGVFAGETQPNIGNYIFGSSMTRWSIWGDSLRAGGTKDSTNQPATLDDILFFNRALSEAEIKALYLNRANTPKFYNINNYILDNTDSVPTENSKNLITSGGVYSALADKQPKTLDTPITVGGTQQTTVEGALGALAQASSADSTPVGTVIRKCGALPAGYINCGKGAVEKFVQNGSISSSYAIQVLLQTADGAVYAGTKSHGLYKSINKGIFTQLSGFSANKSVVALLQTADGSIYAGAEDGLYKSTDGSTFTHLSIPAFYRTVSTLLQTTDGAIYAGLGEDEYPITGLYKSTDNGATFTKLSGTTENLYVTALLQTADGAIYVGTKSSGMYKSTDSGTTFTKLSSVPNSFTIDIILQTVDGSIYTGSGTGLYKSTDGNTFVELTDFPAEHKVTMILQTVDGSILACLGYIGTGESSVYKSTDNGVTFTSVSSFPSDCIVGSLIQLTDGTLYAGTSIYDNASGYGLYKASFYKELSKTTYADLYAVVGDKYNFRAQVSDNTKFAIPLIGDDDLTYGIKY